MTKKIEDQLEIKLANSINRVYEDTLTEFTKNQRKKAKPGSKTRLDRGDKDEEELEDPLNYHGDDFDVKQLLARAPNLVGGKDNDLELALSYLAKKDKNQDGYIEKLIADNEKEREALEKVVQDINAKEKRFQDFTQQVANAGMNPAQQAQAAIQIAQGQQPQLDQIKQAVGHEVQHRIKQIEPREPKSTVQPNAPRPDSDLSYTPSPGQYGVATPATRAAADSLKDKATVRTHQATSPQSTAVTIPAPSQTTAPSPKPIRPINYRQVAAKPHMPRLPQSDVIAKTDQGYEILRNPNPKPTLSRKDLKRAGPWASFLNMPIQDVDTTPFSGFMNEEGSRDPFQNMATNLIYGPEPVTTEIPYTTRLIHKGHNPEQAPPQEPTPKEPPKKAKPQPVYSTGPHPAKTMDEIFQGNGRAIAQALIGRAPAVQLDYGHNIPLTIYRDQIKQISDILQAYHEPTRTHVMQKILTDHRAMLAFIKDNVMGKKKLKKNKRQQELPLEEAMLARLSENITTLWETSLPAFILDKMMRLRKMAAHAGKSEEQLKNMAMAWHDKEVNPQKYIKPAKPSNKYPEEDPNVFDTSHMTDRERDAALEEIGPYGALVWPPHVINQNKETHRRVEPVPGAVKTTRTPNPAVKLDISHGDGTELKRSPEYRRSRQEQAMLKKMQDRVKAGYDWQGDDEEHDYATESLDNKLLKKLSENLTHIWEDWNKVNHHDKTNGLSRKAVNAYRREHPGSKLQTAVTTKPSKLKPGSKAAKRRKSFCARMSGNKGPMRKPNGKPTPKALALRRWHCESIEEMRQLIEYAEQEIAREKMLAEKWSQKYKSSINCSHPKGFSQRAHCAGKKKHNESHEVMEMTCPDCGMCQTHGNMSLNEIKKGQKDSNGYTRCWPGKHAEGTKKGRNGGQVRNCVPNEGVAEGSREMTGTNRDRFISRMSLSIDHHSLMRQLGKVVNSPEFNSDTILKIVDAGDKIQHPVGRYIQKEFDELQYDLGRKYEDYPEEVAEKLLDILINQSKQGVAEGGGAQQAAIAIAKRESGKYTKDGKRKK